ncbi:MAG: hypothetical protein GY865_10600 [candidate division Zixibacteria bacterium]|nr:hypothetical protein [candidate division Zixibacteria bacterium]
MDTNKVKSGLYLFLVIIFGLLNSFTVANDKADTDQNKGQQLEDTSKGDAFLFDMKIFNKKKKTSVRLDIYRKGDSLGVFARGYLGKGVLKALVNSDSIVTFFPTESQYFSGKISELLSANCFDSIPLEKMIVDFFRTTPDKIVYPTGNIIISVLVDSPRFRKFRIMSKDCSESIELDYDFKKGNFLLKKFMYFSADGQFRLEAERRKFRLDVKLSDKKYKISIPPTASRIYP